MTADVAFAHRIRLMKQADGERRLVAGIVLEPGVVDRQNDTVSAAEIEQAAHGFAMGLGLGLSGPDLMHEIDLPEGVHVVQTYIAPVDFTLGNQDVPAGSWVMWMFIEDDEIWADVQAGKINAFSIVGTAQRRPTDSPAE